MLMFFVTLRCCRPEVTIPFSWARGRDRGGGGSAQHFRQKIKIDFIASKAVHSRGPHGSGEFRVMFHATLNKVLPLIFIRGLRLDVGTIRRYYSQYWCTVNDTYRCEQFFHDKLGCIEPPWTPWGLDKMVAISQTTFSSTFPWIKTSEFKKKVSLKYIP